MSPFIGELTPTAIKAIREKLSLSQNQFGSLLNTTASTISRWESGEAKPEGPTAALLKALADKTGDRSTRELKTALAGAALAFGLVVLLEILFGGPQQQQARVTASHARPQEARRGG